MFDNLIISIVDFLAPIVAATLGVYSIWSSRKAGDKLSTKDKVAVYALILSCMFAIIVKIGNLYDSMDRKDREFIQARMQDSIRRHSDSVSSVLQHEVGHGFSKSLASLDALSDSFGITLDQISYITKQQNNTISNTERLLSPMSKMKVVLFYSIKDGFATNYARFKSSSIVDLINLIEETCFHANLKKGRNQMDIFLKLKNLTFAQNSGNSITFKGSNGNGMVQFDEKSREIVVSITIDSVELMKDHPSSFVSYLDFEGALFSMLYVNQSYQNYLLKSVFILSSDPGPRLLSATFEESNAVIKKTNYLFEDIDSVKKIYEKRLVLN